MIIPADIPGRFGETTFIILPPYCLNNFMAIKHQKTMSTRIILIFAAVMVNLFAVSAQNAHNPIIYADVPDLSMIRVGDNYYMSSTTMHMSPGVPIMKSKDLVNWHLVNYAYDTLANIDALNLINGKNAYGKGSWASSLRYHNGTYYVSTFAQTTGRTHIYTTKDIEKGPWKAVSFKPSLHDHSLFFDDDGKTYLVTGSGKIRLVELNNDLSGIKPGGIDQTIIENAGLPSGGTGLGAEGSQLFKIKGKYYLFNITWPRGGMRTVIIHRADKITGPWEGRVGFQDQGVAQGGLIDRPDGTWYAYLFRDYGAVGRVPYLVPVEWEDGWPVLGVNGKAPEALDLPANESLIPGIVASDEFNRKSGERALPLVWQWNHNPDNSLWSLTAKKGYLRLTTGRIDTDFMTARNSLTQRTIGPVCSGSIALDISNMKDGDFAGLGLLQKNYGQAGVKIDGSNKVIVMINAGTGKPQTVQTVPLTQKTIYLKAECNFIDKKDIAEFFYSLDGKSWTHLGIPLKMTYTLPHFMGYRFALFNYSTKVAGGSADFDFFRISNQITDSK
jgi:beta-xylosidase